MKKAFFLWTIAALGITFFAFAGDDESDWYLDMEKSQKENLDVLTRIESEYFETSNLEPDEVKELTQSFYEHRESMKEFLKDATFELNVGQSPLLSCFNIPDIATKVIHFFPSHCVDLKYRKIRHDLLRELFSAVAKLDETDSRSAAQMLLAGWNKNSVAIPPHPLEGTYEFKMEIDPKKVVRIAIEKSTKGFLPSYTVRVLTSKEGWKGATLNNGNGQVFKFGLLSRVDGKGNFWKAHAENPSVARKTYDYNTGGNFVSEAKASEALTLIFGRNHGEPGQDVQLSINGLMVRYHYYDLIIGGSKGVYFDKDDLQNVYYYGTKVTAQEE